MIAIASGLLSNLETGTPMVVKKDGGLGGFAAAFEEVAAKDAGAVAQDRRGAGGAIRGRQVGIVGERSGRPVNSAAKAAVAKAAGKVSVDGNVPQVKGAAGAGVVGKVASPTVGDAGKPLSAAKVNAANFVEAESAGQEASMGSEVRVGGPSVRDKARSSSGVKYFDGAASTVGGALPGGSAKESLQSWAGASTSNVPNAGTVAQVGGEATAEIKIGLRVDAAIVQTQSADVAAAVESASAKAVVGALPDGAAFGGTTADKSESRGVAILLEDSVGVDGTAAPKVEAPEVAGAAGISGRPARAAKDTRSVAATKAVGVSDGVQVSAAKPGLQQVAGTRNVQPTDVPVPAAVLAVAQEGSSSTRQPVANLTPVDGAEQASSGPSTVTSGGVDGTAEQVSKRGNASVAPRSTVGQKTTAQQVSAPSAFPLPITVQQAVAQESIVQTARAVPQGSLELVAQDALSVARVSGAPVAGSGQVTGQQAALEIAGSKQVEPLQVQSSHTGAQQVGAEQLSIAEEGTLEHEPAPSMNGAAEPVQHAGKPIVAGADAGVNGAKDKHTSSVAPTASSSGKKVAASESNRSSDAHAGVVSTAANASVPAAPVSVPSLSASPVATAQAVPVVSLAEETNKAAAGAGAAKASITAVPVRGGSASPLTAGIVAAQADAPGLTENSDTVPATIEVAGQGAISEGSAITGVVGQAQESLAPVSAAVMNEVAGLQAGRVAAGGTAAMRERRAPATEGKTAQRTSAETTPQPITLQDLAGAGPEAAKPSSGSHPSSSELGTHSLATGTAGLGGGGGVVPLSTTQVATHGTVAPNIAATITASATVQSSTLTSGSGGLASTDGAGMASLVSPMAHTTLQATPTVLEVGVPGGTHGWLKIRAEIGEGGAVQASVSAATHEGQETLRRELPAMNAFLDSEHVPVSIQVAAHGLSGAGASSVAGGETGFNLGSSLSQDAGSAQREAQPGLLAGGDGARRGGGEGTQDSSRATAAANGASTRAAVSAESDWISTSNADSGSGYGSGMAANGGSWLNVMA